MTYKPSNTYTDDPRKLASQRWESKQKHYSLRLTPELWDEVYSKAKKLGVSINSYIIGLIQSDVKEKA